MAEQILHENEVKTNAIAVKTIMVLMLAMMAFVLLDFLHILNVAPDWSLQIMVIASVCLFFICAFIKRNAYDRPYIKSIILIAVILYTGMMHCLFPLTSVFFLFGPILISIRYYDRDFTLRVAIVTWLFYIVTVILNLILETSSPYIQELHRLQGTTVWQYPMDVLLYYGIVRTLLFTLTTIIAIQIVVSGKKMIMDQEEMYKKTSELEDDLNAAARIQRGTMAEPDFVTADKRIMTYAGIDPAKDVGGDFFDRFKVDDNVTCLVMADVSDKGISAAMFSMRALTAIRFVIKDMAYRGEFDLAFAVQKMNQLLVHSNSDDMFVTVWIGCIDSRTGVGRYVNAGHMPPIIRHKDGSTDILECEPQLMVGMIPDIEYESAMFRLFDGDSLILYTDGITDARNVNDEMFGMDGFIKTIESGDPELYLDPKIAYTYLAETVDAYTEGNTQFDDETIMVVNYDGAPNTLEGDICVVKEDAADMASGTSSLSSAIDAINAKLLSRNCPEEERRNIDVMIDEVGTNIFDYGFENAPSDVHPQFTISYEIGDNFIVMDFRDKGMKFDPTAGPEVEITDTPKFGGLGIHLIKNLSDEVSYRYEDGYNILTVKKVWKSHSIMQGGD